MPGRNGRYGRKGVLDMRHLFSKGVNDSSKVSNYSVKRLSTTSGKREKTVNQNQEKTNYPAKDLVV